jgi:tripartite-type tricarboxylate transporter receptor subunit TctC
MNPQQESDYPEKPITLIVGFPPGGSLDLTAQPLATALKEYLPQEVVVVHRPGNSGTKGMAELLTSASDGYFLCMGAMGLLTIQPHIRDLPYKTADDYTPIINLVNNPVGLAVRSDAPWRTVEEFVADAQANPGKIHVADLGMGSALHLATEQLKETARIDLVPLHLSGSPECVEALRDGKVEAVTNHHAVFTEDVDAGRFRVLGVFEKSRNPLFPEAQTFREAGYDVIFDSYACLIGPKGLPANVVTTLHDACKKALDDPVFAEPMKERGLDLFYQGPDELKKTLIEDYEANKKVVKSIGLKAK